MAEPGEQEIVDPGTSERSPQNMTRPLDPQADPAVPLDPSAAATSTSASASTSAPTSAPPASVPTSAPPTSAPPATPAPSAPPATGEGRRGPDLLTLVVGLMSLAAAVLVATGWAPQLRLFDLRWVLSGGAVVLGVLLLAASVRSPRKP